MANTYTSNTIRVNNGDSTTFDTSDAADGIRILSAECRWRGVQTSSTSNDTSYSTNTNYDSATATSGTSYHNNSTSGSATATQSTNYNTDTVSNTATDSESDYERVDPYESPSPPSYNGTAQSWKLTYEYKITHEGNGADADSSSGLYVSGDTTNKELNYNDLNANSGWQQVLSESGSGSVNTYTYINGDYSKNYDDVSMSVRITAEVTYQYSSTSTNNDTVTRSYPSVPNGYNFHKHEKIIDGNKNTYYSNKVGQNESVTSTNPNNTRNLTLKTYGKKTNTNSRTASTSFPSVPNGYNFSRHREQKSNGTNNYHYSNKVGQSRSITSNSTNNTVWVRLKTRGKKTTSSTSYYDTRDPSVSEDASASYNGTISDGNWTSWNTLNGFSPGSNTLNHSISESNKADFQIRYEWEYDVPTAVQTAKIKINGTTYSVALADMADPALVYDFYRTFTPTNGTLAFDVVDPSDSDSIPYYIYHPTHGKVSLRQLN